MIPYFKENLINVMSMQQSNLCVKEALEQTIDNSLRSDIDRRIIKHVGFDHDVIVKAMTKMIGAIADSNHIKIEIPEKSEEKLILRKSTKRDDLSPPSRSLSKTKPSELRSKSP